MNSTAIITSVVSLFDASLDFQSNICRSYCNKMNLNVTIEFREHGYISKKTLTAWDNNIIDNNIRVYVFYQIKQLAFSTEEFYNIIIDKINSSINIHFVRDSLLFNGYPPTFNPTTLNIKSYNRRKIRDLIALMKMSTCSNNVIKEYINNNFGNINVLLKLINSNISLITNLLSSNHNRKKNSKLNIIRFRRFKNNLRRLRNDDILIVDICNEFKKMNV
nr:serine recombinase [Wadden Sea poxvirus]